MSRPAKFQTKREYDEDYRRRFPEKIKKNIRRWELKKRYNTTPEEYQAKLEKQNNLCACCGNPETQLNKRTGFPKQLSQDHDHYTGESRGLVYGTCNGLVLAVVEKYPHLIPKAFEYLKPYKMEVE